MLPIRNPLKNRLEVRSYNKIHVNTNPKKAGVSALTSDKVDFRGKNINENKKDYFMLIMESTIQENITILNSKL